MADPAFPSIDRDLAARLDLLVPPALPADFAARLAAAAQETPQVPAFTPLPAARRRAIGRRARLGIAAGSLALIGLGSVSAAAAGYLGEPVNRAVHRLPVVGKLIEKVIPEKRHIHHSEAALTAGLHHRHGGDSRAAARPEPRPAIADAPPIALAPMAPMVAPGWRAGRLHVAPPWRFPGPLPRSFPPGPERRAAIAALREWRAAHPLPAEVIARRQRRAAIMAERRTIRAERLEQQGEATVATSRPEFQGDAALDRAERVRLRRERRRARIEAWRSGAMRDSVQPLPFEAPRQPRWRRHRPDLPPPDNNDGINPGE